MGKAWTVVKGMRVEGATKGRSEGVGVDADAEARCRCGVKLAQGRMCIPAVRTRTKG